MSINKYEFEWAKAIAKGKSASSRKFEEKKIKMTGERSRIRFEKA